MSAAEAELCRWAIGCQELAAFIRQDQAASLLTCTGGATQGAGGYIDYRPGQVIRRTRQDDGTQRVDLKVTRARAAALLREALTPQLREQVLQASDAWGAACRAHTMYAAGNYRWLTEAMRQAESAVWDAVAQPAEAQLELFA